MYVFTYAFFQYHFLVRNSACFGYFLSVVIVTVAWLLYKFVWYLASVCVPKFAYLRSVCSFVCLCVYIYTYTYTYTYIYIYEFVCVYVRLRVRLDCTYTHTDTHVYVCIHIDTKIHRYIYTCAYKHIYDPTYV